MKKIALILFACLASVLCKAQIEVAFSHERGFYNNTISLELASNDPTATIRYTSDFSPPSVTNGIIYSGPISISSSSFIRAIAYTATESSTTVTHSYFFMNDVINHDSLRAHIVNDPVWGPQLENAFLDIPTVSICTDQVIDPDIKVAASVEFIFPETGENIQANCGIKLFGNGGAHTDRLSMRLYFDEEWGPKNLKYPLFEGFDENIEAIEKFDKIDLRHGWYNTWDNYLHDIRFDDYKRHNYVSTKIGDDLLMHMGQLSPHTRFMHVYNNGVYNGIITLRERFDPQLIGEYMNTDNEAYEYLATPNQRVSTFHPFSPELKQGTGAHWANLVAASNTSYTAWKNYIDEDNFFDRMIIFLYGQGEAEYRALAAPQEGQEFILNVNDSDYFFYGGDPIHSNRTNPLHNLNGPDNMFLNLFNSQDPDFRMDFADRVHMHLTGDGALTHNQVFPHYQEIADIIDNAIIAESAR